MNEKMSIKKERQNNAPSFFLQFYFYPKGINLTPNVKGYNAGPFPD